MATPAKDASAAVATSTPNSGTIRKSDKKHHKHKKNSTSSSESSQPSPTPSPLPQQPEKKNSSASLSSAPFEPIMKAALENGDLLQLHVMVGYHHSFMKAGPFLTFLISQFEQGQKKVKESVLAALMMWCDLRFTRDFLRKKTKKGHKTFTRLLAFIQQVEKMAPPSREFGPARTTSVKMAILRNYYGKFRPRKVGPNSQQNMQQDTAPELLSELADQQAKREAGQFLSCFWWAHPVEVALKFFQIEFVLFKRIDTRELVNLSWKRPDAAQKCSNVLEMIARSNNVSFWVASKVVKTGDQEKRVLLIERCIELAEACEKMHNFNTLMSILGGLNLHPVQRLKRTWEKVSESHMKIMQRLEEFMESKGNYRNYRERLKLLRDSENCVLPYLGLYLRDLVFIDEGQDTRINNNQLNRDKVQMTVSLLAEFKDFQARQIKEGLQKPSNAELGDEMWDYYENMRGMSEAAVLKLSRLLEAPRSHPVPSTVETSYSNTSLDAQSQSSATASAVPSSIALSPSGTLVTGPRHSSAGTSEADEASASSESSQVNSASTSHIAGLKQSRSGPSAFNSSVSSPQAPMPLASPKRPSTNNIHASATALNGPSTNTSGHGSRIGAPPSPTAHRP